MSQSSERGKSFEIKVQKITKQKLHLDIKRDSRSGAGLHKQDIRDRYNLLPIFIECKDHETIKPKAWWREADHKASFGQAPIVVFPDEDEVLCVMRYTDLLNFIKEAADWKEEADDLRKPVAPAPDTVRVIRHRMSDEDIQEAVAQKKAANAKQCREGHLADDYGYCMQLKCRYSRGYRPPKVKKK